MAARFKFFNVIKSIYFILIIGYCHTLHSQMVAITVKDELDNDLKNFSVYKNSNFIGQSSDYVYFLKCALSDTIQIKKDGLHSFDFIIQSSADTTYHTFILLPKVQDVDAVSVTKQTNKTLAGDLNDNILDFFYFPDQQTFLLLKSNKGAYYLEQKTDLTSRSYILNFKPQSLFLDIFGNTHIISKDSTYQIWIDDSLNYISIIPKKLFETKIKPLIYKNSDFVLYENYTLHNQCYVLSKTDKSNNVYVVSKSFDKVAYNVANVEYNEVIKLYNEQTPQFDNVISNGTWNGQLEMLGENSDLLNQIIWYKNVRAKPIDCHSFGLIDNIILVNFFNEQIEKYSFNGALAEIVKLAPAKIKNGELIYDYFYAAIYVFGRDEKNTHTIYRINTTSGEYEFVSSMKGKHPEMIKIVGKDIFYLERNEAGYRKLYKAQLE